MQYIIGKDPFNEGLGKEVLSFGPQSDTPTVAAVYRLTGRNPTTLQEKIMYIGSTYGCSSWFYGERAPASTAAF